MRSELNSIPYLIWTGKAENLRIRVGTLLNHTIMKKPLKELTLSKEVISNLELNKIEGGHSACCPTYGALNSCPPPGVQCY